MAIKFKRGTKTAWDASELILEDGQPGVARDTGDLRIGNGINTWRALPKPNVGAGEERINFLRYATTAGGSYSATTDHSAALLAAITAANGKEVFIPENYVANLATGVTISDNTPVNIKGRIRCSSSAVALSITRPMESPLGVTVTRSFQFGATGTLGMQLLSKIILTSGSYSQFRAADAYHISSDDEYEWFGDDAQTAHPVLAGYLTIMGLGMDMPTVTASPPVEFLMVEGASSGSQAMIQSVIAGAGSAAKQVVFHKTTGNFTADENLLAMTTGGVSPYTAGTVIGTAGTLYILKAGERFIDNYATSVQIRKLNQAASLKLDITLDTASTTDTDAHQTATRREAVIVRGQYGSDVMAEIRGAFSKALLFKSCYYGRVTPVVIGALPNHTLDTAFGYGVSVDGATEGFDIIQPYGRYLRHAFTTNNNYTALWYASGVSDTGVSKLYEWGTVKNITVHGGYGQDTSAAPWDVHPGAYNVHFIGTRGIAPAGGGRAASTSPQVFSNRGYGTKWIGVSAKGGGIQDSSFGSSPGFFYTNEIIGGVIEDFLYWGVNVPFDGEKDPVSGKYWGKLIVKGTTFKADPDYTAQYGLGLRAMRAIVEDCRIAGVNGPPILVTAGSSGGLLEFMGTTLDFSESTTPTPIQIDGTAEVSLDLTVRSHASLTSLIQFVSGSTNVALLPPKRIGSVALPQAYSNDVGATGNVTWRGIEGGTRPVSVIGDSSQSVTPLTSTTSLYYNTPLTTTRTVTISSTDGTAINGWSLLVKRSAAATSVTGTRYVNVVHNSVTLVSLGPDEWAEIKYGGTTVGYYVERQSTESNVVALFEAALL